MSLLHFPMLRGGAPVSGGGGGGGAQFSDGFAQIAAIIGKPSFVKNNKILSAVWDAICANYGKAKNANTQS